MGDTAGSDKDHAVRGVVGLDVVGELGSSDVANILAGAKNGATQGLVLEGSGMQMVEDNLLYLLLNFLGFAQNDIALALNGGLLELGVLQDIGQDIDAPRNVGVEGLGEVDGVFALSNFMLDPHHVVCLPRREPKKGGGGGGLRVDVDAHRGIGVQVTTHVLNLKF